MFQQVRLHIDLYHKQAFWCFTCVWVVKFSCTSSPTVVHRVLLLFLQNHVMLNRNSFSLQRNVTSNNNVNVNVVSMTFTWRGDTRYIISYVAVTTPPAIGNFIFVCDGKPYNVRTHICCDKTIRSRGRDYEKTACCGDLAYDERTRICCDNKIRSRGRHYKKTACCGDLAYEPKTLTPDRICCDKKLRYTGPDHKMTACCADRAYNNRTRICCKNKIRSRGKHQKKSECCGDLAYNRKIHICVKEQLYPLSHLHAESK